MKCERMRASTLPCLYIYISLYLSCRFWHRCGRRFGRPSFGFWFAIWVTYSVATVLRDQRCIRFPLAGLTAKSPQVFPSVGASFARRVMAMEVTLTQLQARLQITTVISAGTTTFMIQVQPTATPTFLPLFGLRATLPRAAYCRECVV